MGELCWLLSIEVKRDCTACTITFSQAAYIERILCCFNLQDANPLSMPMDPHHQLTKAQFPSTPREYELMRGVPYQEAIGSLMYATLGTHPDIAFTISVLSQ